MQYPVQELDYVKGARDGSQLSLLLNYLHMKRYNGNNQGQHAGGTRYCSQNQIRESNHLGVRGEKRKKNGIMECQEAPWRTVLYIVQRMDHRTLC